MYPIIHILFRGDARRRGVCTADSVLLALAYVVLLLRLLFHVQFTVGVPAAGLDLASRRNTTHEYGSRERNVVEGEYIGARVGR